LIKGIESFIAQPFMNTPAGFIGGLGIDFAPGSGKQPVGWFRTSARRERAQNFEPRANSLAGVKKLWAPHNFP
jgi:hypothetical protein